MAKELKFVMLLDCYGDLLTDRQRGVMELYYCEDLSLSEIGADIGVTRQAVLNLIKRAETILLDYENKLGFAEKLVKMRERLGAIGSAAASIENEMLRNDIVREVNKGLELL